MTPEDTAHATKSLTTRSRRRRSLMPHAVANRRQVTLNCGSASCCRSVSVRTFDLAYAVSGFSGEVSFRGVSSARPYMLQLDAKTKAFTPWLLAFRARFDTCAMVDVVGHVLERLAHRIVGDRGEVDDRIDILQRGVGKRPHVGEVLDIEACLRKHLGTGQAMREISGVEPDQRGIGPGLPELANDDGPDVPHVACYEYSHIDRSAFACLVNCSARTLSGSPSVVAELVCVLRRPSPSECAQWSVPRAGPEVIRVGTELTTGGQQSPPPAGTTGLC